MRWRYILNITGIFSIFFGLTMILPLLFGLYFRDQSVIPLLKSMGITMAAGFILYIIFRSPKTEFINQREGMAIVAIGWTAIGLFGALPFYFDALCHTFTTMPTGGFSSKNASIAHFDSVYFDFVTSFSAVAASIGNIGPGFGLVGPVDNYAHIPYLGKWLLIWCMLLGRLEIYTVIILLAPEFWRK